MKRLASIVTSFPFRLLVTVGLLVPIAIAVDWGALVDTLAEGEWVWFVAAVGLQVLVIGIGALRWHWLLTAARLPLSMWQSVRAYWIGIFANNFLPTGFGGDAARGFLVARGGEALARSFTSVFVDRVSSIGCLMLIGLGASVLSPQSIPSELRLVLLVASLVGLAAALALVLAARSHRIRRMLPERIRPYAREVEATLTAYAADRRLIALLLSIGVFFQALVVGTVWMLARCLDLDLSFALIAVVLPLVLIVTVFPISIAGFGVREGGFVVALGTVDVSATDATLLSLLAVAALAIASLPGALALLTSGTRAKLAAEPLGFEP